jgi:hypothetical protein
MRPYVLLAAALLLTPGQALSTSPTQSDFESGRHFSQIQKKIVIWDYENQIVQCIGVTVTKDPRYSSANRQLGELIVDSISSTCQPFVRWMVYSYDELFGAGGETYMMGPHLDYIQKAVPLWIKEHPQ